MAQSLPYFHGLVGLCVWVFWEGWMAHSFRSEFPSLTG